MQFDHEQMHLSGNIAELLAYVRTISASHCCIDNLKVIFDLRFCGANPRLVFSERQTIRSDLALNYSVIGRLGGYLLELNYVAHRSIPAFAVCTSVPKPSDRKLVTLTKC